MGLGDRKSHSTPQSVVDLEPIRYLGYEIYRGSNRVGGDLFWLGICFWKLMIISLELEVPYQLSCLQKTLGSCCCCCCCGGGGGGGGGGGCVRYVSWGRMFP